MSQFFIFYSTSLLRLAIFQVFSSSHRCLVEIGSILPMYLFWPGATVVVVVVVVVVQVVLVVQSSCSCSSTLILAWVNSTLTRTHAWVLEYYQESSVP